MEFYDFPFSWECHHPNRRTHIFQRGRRVGIPPTRYTYPICWGKRNVTNDPKRTIRGMSHQGVPNVDLSLQDLLQKSPRSTSQQGELS